jgi:hypothetical protein
MLAPSPESIHDRDLLPALRELFSRYPTTSRSAPETLSDLLYELRYLSYRPEPFAVEAACEALLFENEVLP